MCSMVNKGWEVCVTLGQLQAVLDGKQVGG